MKTTTATIISSRVPLQFNEAAASGGGHSLGSAPQQRLRVALQPRWLQAPQDLREADTITPVGLSLSSHPSVSPQKRFLYRAGAANISK